MHTVSQAQPLSFVSSPAEQSLRTGQTNRYSHLQKEATVSATTYDQVLLHYQTFVDASIEDYRQSHGQPVQQGGPHKFFDQRWTLLLNDAVAEAGNLLNGYVCDFQQKEKLLQDLKRISEGCLLVLDKAMA